MQNRHVDSFTDLWSSSAPTKLQPQTLGAASISTASLDRRPQHDVFTLLSSSGTSASNSRSITPVVTAQQKVKPTPSAGGEDAFSGLLSGSLAASNNARMTMAERAAQAERQRLEDLRKQQHVAKTQTSSRTWDGLDSLANSSSPAALKPFRVSSNPDSLLEDDDWGFANVPPSNPKPPVNTGKAASPPVDDGQDDWSLDDFGTISSRTSSQSNSRPSASVQPKSIWELDELPSPPSSSTKLISTTQDRTNSPGDFDFGNREDALLDDDSDDGGDILGALSKPVDAIPKRPSRSNQNHSSSSNNTSRRTTVNGPSSRSTSPPPHILGKIVEMGFSIQQARVALASTDTGLDVEAALDTLLANGAGSSPSSSPPASGQMTASPQSPEYDSRQAHGTTRLMGGSTRDRNSDRDASSSSSLSQQDRERNIQEQADKLLAQASEIGLSVLSKASSIWKEGKGRVQKAYEERAAAAPSNGPPGGRDGRPKWMQGVPARRDADGGDNNDGGWRNRDRDREGDGDDGFSDEVPPPRPSRATVKPRKADVQPYAQAARTNTADIFSTDEPVAAYVSPFRRGKSAPQPTQPPPPHARPRAPSPIRPSARTNLVSASASAIARSSQYKSTGSAKFKLGQYADAESAYTAGIACLPQGHLLLVPLYNNRALARLRTGDHAGAAEDAGQVVEIIGEGYHPAHEEVVRGEEYVGGEEGGVDLAEGLVKALKRRAEAWEGRERWDEAGMSWEMLAGKDWVRPAAKGEAVRGAGRCRRGRRMVAQVQAADHSAEDSNPKPKPKLEVRSRPIATVSTGPSEALLNLRSVNDAAEREEQARHELKDAVDRKLGAWKGGKEANIRALLGSLDLVLWPALGLRKVGMADLVSTKQVKAQYTRVIARLHPDKLNASNTSVEQRMIANGVFGALNEAWNAFKS